MRFRSDPVPEHGDVSVPEDGQIEALLSEAPPELEPDAPAATYVVSLGDWTSDVQRDAQLAEILGLVEANGHPIVGHESRVLKNPHRRTHVGPGVARALADRARAAGASLLVLDAPLSPSQTRNLEDIAGLSVSDREIVILGVFHRHARSKAARIQVEIARLQYLRPRIRGLGLDMDQQAGGGLYGRGAGETASELLARQIDDRLVRLRRAFSKLERAGAEHRKRREDTLRIALVGYTNAGKTSLMNALSGSELATRSRPFETLDTTTRCLTRHGGEVLLTDTVGFIRDLPKRLLASFSTTLSEAQEADLLAIVVDLSDPEWPLHLKTTEAQLDALGADGIARFTIFNKRDQVDVLPELDEGTVGPYRVVSSHDATDTDALRDALIETVRGARLVNATLHVPYAAAEVSTLIYSACRVVDSDADDEGMILTFQGSPGAVARVMARGEEAGCRILLNHPDR
ncbi:MAG: GTPase HflX [Myxococcota bacterium]